MKRGIARFLSFCRYFSQARFAGANPSPSQTVGWALPTLQGTKAQAIRLRWSGYIIIPLILFSLCCPLEAGTWAGTFGGAGTDGGNSIQQTSNGGYVLTSSTTSFGAGNADVLVLRLDSSGNIVWQKAFGGTSTDYGRSIQQTSDGGYILTGETASFGTGNSDVLVLRLNSSGSIVWQKTFGGTRVDQGYFIQQTSDGGYILTGYTSSFGAGNSDVLVLRLDSSGTIVWQKTFGGANFDQGKSIQQTSDGGYILTGDTYSFGAGAWDVLVLRLDSSGNIVWQKIFGGTSTDLGLSIQQTSDGGYILTGRTNSFRAGNQDVVVLRLDSSGTIVWQKTFGGTSVDQGYFIQQTSDGGYVLTGSTASFGAGNYDVLLLRLDSSGSIVWQKTFGGTNDDRGQSIQQTSDGGYVLTGITASFGAGGYDVLVLRLDSSGNVSGCGDFNNINMTVNTPSVTVNSINSTVTNPNQSMANVGVTVNNPSVTAGTRCTYTGSTDDLVVDFGNFNAGINAYFNNDTPWTSRHHWGPGAYNMVMGDLDGNGKADLIVDFGPPWGINVYHNNTGPWTRIHDFSPGPGRMVVGDLDGNGQDDLIVDFGNFNAGINVYYNNSGPWTSVHPYGPGQGRMVVGDMDGNGKADLIVDFGNFNAGINVYYNNAAPWTSLHPFSPGMGRMVTGDLDGNGKKDLIVDFGNFNAGINVYYNNSAPWTSIHPYGPGAYRMVTGDMDGDGKADLIVDFGDFNAGINVYYNNAAPWTSIHPYGPGSGRMVVGDLGEDGKADLIVDFGNFNAGINVYYNNSTPWTSRHPFGPGEGRMVRGNMDGN